MKRIYKIASQEDDFISLVRANSPAQALRHAVNKLFTVKVASQEDIVTALGSGLEVETVGETETVDSETSTDGSEIPFG